MTDDARAARLQAIRATLQAADRAKGMYAPATVEFLLDEVDRLQTENQELRQQGKAVALDRERLAEKCNEMQGELDELFRALARYVLSQGVLDRDDLILALEAITGEDES